MANTHVAYDEFTPRRGYVQLNNVQLDSWVYAHTGGTISVPMGDIYLKEGWERVHWSCEPQPVTFEAKLRHELETWQSDKTLL